MTSDPCMSLPNGGRYATCWLLVPLSRDLHGCSFASGFFFPATDDRNKKENEKKKGEQFSAHCRSTRFRVVANLSDSTGTISATLFGNELKKLTSCTPIQMMNLFEEGRIDCIEDVVNKFNWQEHIFQLKAYQYGSAVNFTVLSIDDIRTDSQI